eukprot:5507754-Amphidinium_carterae.1
MAETDPLTEEPAKKRQRMLPRTEDKEDVAAQDVIVHIENEAIGVVSQFLTFVSPVFRRMLDCGM